MQGLPQLEATKQTLSDLKKRGDMESLRIEKAPANYS
jgi:hypothetical protein